jgi:hypothetical protein
MKKTPTLDDLRQVARRAFAKDPKQLQSVLRDIDTLDRLPPIEGSAQDAARLTAELNRQARRDRLSLVLMVVGFAVTAGLELYFGHFARHGFNTFSIAMLLATATVVGVMIFARERFGATRFWIVFLLLAGAALAWGLQY